MRKILLVVFSSLIAIIVAEFSARIFIHSDEFYTKEIWNHWQSNDDMSSSDYRELYNQKYSYSADLGYEKTDVYSKILGVSDNCPDCYKILVLGDSVSEYGTYVDLLSEKLKNEFTQNLLIVNAGVMGYDTHMEYLYLKNRGIDLNPDLVILQFCPNDLERTPVIIKQDDGSWLAYNSDNRMTFNSSLFSKSRLYQLFVTKFYFKDKGDFDMKDNVEEPLNKIKIMLQKRNIPFKIVIFPYFADDSFQEVSANAINQVINDLDLKNDVINLTDYYKEFRFEDVSRDALHPNEEGDRIAAEVIFSHLKPFLNEEIK